MHQGGDRRHPETGTGLIIRQTTDHLDMTTRQTDLFFSLTQGGRDWVSIFGIDSPTGEADLSGVVIQVRGSQGQQQVELILTQHHRQQYRGRHRLALVSI